MFGSDRLVASRGFGVFCITFEIDKRNSQRWEDHGSYSKWGHFWKSAYTSQLRRVCSTSYLKTKVILLNVLKLYSLLKRGEWDVDDHT